MGYSHTYQEHMLMGSTVNEERYKKEPYKPLYIVDGTKTIEQVRESRKLMKVCNALGDFFCKEGHFVTMKLENIDEEGNTIRDPRLVDRQTDELIPTEYSDDFPCRRKI